MRIRAFLASLFLALLSFARVGAVTPADHLRISDPVQGWSQVMVASPSVSSFLKVVVEDSSGAVTVAGVTTTISFQANDASGTPVPAEVSFDNFVTTVTGVGLSGAATSTPDFQIRTAVTGNMTLTATASNFPSGGQSRTAYYGITVLPPGSGFTNLALRTDDAPGGTGVGVSSVTITPDRNGVGDGAVFSAQSPDPNGDWELWISTEASFTTGVVKKFFRYGAGDVFWYGENMESQPLKNGVYLARFQTSGGGVLSSVLSVAVQSNYLKGTVTDGVNPIGDATVNASGQGGGGWGRTAADGTFFIAGLQAGPGYSLEVRKPGFTTVSTGPVTASTSPTPQLIPLSPAAQIRLQVQVSAPTPHDIFGHVFAHDAAYSKTANAPLRLSSGTMATDNGLWATDPAFSTWTVLDVAPNTSYQLEIQLPEYGQIVVSTTSLGSLSSVDVVALMNRKANVYGIVQFASPVATPYGGQWVSVDALPAGGTGPSAWGGAWLPDGQSSGVYRVSGVDIGTYTFRASARGFQPLTLSTTVSSLADLGNPSTGGGADFAPFAVGNVIVGTVTVTGDTSQSFGGGFSSCGPGQIALHLNAWSPTAFSGGDAEVCLSTGSGAGFTASAPYAITGLGAGDYDLHAFLPGFDPTPPLPKRVTITGASVTQDLTFNAHTGSLKVSALLRTGDAVSQVLYRLSAEGPLEGAFPLREGTLLPGIAPFTGEVGLGNLGSGHYRLALANNNPGSGLVKSFPLAVVNGSTTTLSADLRDTTYAIAGSLNFQGNVILGNPFNVVVSSAAGFQAAVGSAPIVAAYAFPLPDHFDSQVFLPTRTTFATVFPASATYSLPGLTQGTYLVRILQELNPPSPPANCGGCPPPPGFADWAGEDRIVFIGTGSATGMDLTVFNGARLSGTLSRPVGDASTDPRQFTLTLRRTDNILVWRVQTDTAGSGAANYVFDHLSPGDYILDVREETSGSTFLPKYAFPSVKITIGRADVAQNITLTAAGTLVGRLRDADSGTLLTANNAFQFLPGRFSIFAQANPWVPGGWGEAERNPTGAGFDLDPQSGQFRIPRLIPDTTYDVTFRGFDSLGPDELAKGLRPYSPRVVSGLKLSAGQVLDMGTVDLAQGVSLSGTVTDAAGVPLANIPVMAQPSVKNNRDRGGWRVRGFTDGQGRFVVDGVDRDQRYYDVTASPRPEGRDFLAGLGGVKYGAETLRQVDVTTPATRAGLAFKLTLANAAVRGKVATADGGILETPFDHGDQGQRERGAVIFLHRDGDALGDNPIGEIEEMSAPDGNFNVAGLKPGAYTATFAALGYGSLKRSFTVASGGTADLGTVTLTGGAQVSGTITKPDGSNPSRADVRFVVGVDAAFQDFVFGNVEENSDTQLVTGYSLSGFRPNKTYSIIVGNDKDEILELYNQLNFTASTETKVVNLVFRPAPPKVFVTQNRAANTYTLRFFSTQPLRNLTTADNDLDQIVITTGLGTITAKDLNPARDVLTVTYDAAPTETTFDMGLAFRTVVPDPDDPLGEEFLYQSTFTFYAGVGLRRSATIPNVTGGDCVLEGDPTGVTFDSGAFDVASSSEVEVGVQSAATLADLGIAALPTPRARASALATATRRLGAAAYPASSLYKAVQKAVTVNPFSAFYDIFLPAGVSHNLKQDALLTLNYDSSITDPSSLNVYYYDEKSDVFLLENSQRQVDAVNHTITVGVSHLSTFVVLASNAAVVAGSGYTGTEIQLYNFPNPFSLDSKTLTLAHPGTGGPSSLTTEGTALTLALPAGKSGTATIEILTAAGESVRTLTATGLAAGSYNYIEWDGRNDAGKKVASGVYLARFTLDGSDERFVKMAVRK
jgi:hypothetical protein